MTCVIDQTKNDEKEVCWARGDSDAKGFVVQDSDGDAVDITGFSFKLTVNSDRDPDDQTNEQFSVMGVIGDPAAGEVSFAPSTIDTDIEPGLYYYDIEQTDGSGRIKTLIKSKCRIHQDITKV